MKTQISPTSIVLVGFQDQDNLGLRYLMSSVQQAGFAAQIVTYQSNPEPLVELALKANPPVIGFSLIFQYMAPDFCRVIQALRDAGITAHITMGGHYPSFDYAEVLRRIPGLDSIVRFEGEPTLVELMQKLEHGEDWHHVRGIAYRKVKRSSPRLCDHQSKILILCRGQTAKTSTIRYTNYQLQAYSAVAAVRGTARSAAFVPSMKHRKGRCAVCVVPKP
jgi:radical SAM superfamily enzyme YgiQ (UPF0313 family)